MNLYKYNIEGHSYYTVAKNYADAEMTIKNLVKDKRIQSIKLVTMQLTFFNYD